MSVRVWHTYFLDIRAFEGVTLCTITCGTATTPIRFCVLDPFLVMFVFYCFILRNLSTNETRQTKRSYQRNWTPAARHAESDSSFDQDKYEKSCHRNPEHARPHLLECALPELYTLDRCSLGPLNNYVPYFCLFLGFPWAHKLWHLTLTGFYLLKYRVLRGSISSHYDEKWRSGDHDLGGLPEELVELPLDLSSLRVPWGMYDVTWVSDHWQVVGF